MLNQRISFPQAQGVDRSQNPSSSVRHAVLKYEDSAVVYSAFALLDAVLDRRFEASSITEITVFRPSKLRRIRAPHLISRPRVT